jgi:pimeloyl-ACP methyl ester carboxylesterase
MLLASLLMLWGAAAEARDISGLYQSTLRFTRYLEIARKKGGGYQGRIFYPGDVGGNDDNGNTISTITVSGNKISFSFDNRKGNFHGSVSADGKNLVGNWQVMGPADPLTFSRIPRDTVIDPSRHTTHMITVDKNVRLEVLDWGGDGPPLVFMTGLGNTAHIFDNFAPRFVAHHHVYAITRRGFGISSKPIPDSHNYDADRLGDDVVAVLDALKLDHPILAGHSIAGEELSSIGLRHPGRAAALIYMEAGHGYALYSPGGQVAFGTNLVTETRDIEAKLDYLKTVARDPKALPAAIADVQTALPDLEADLKSMTEALAAGMGMLSAPPPDGTLSSRISEAILDGEHRYGHVDGPILAIYAVPPVGPPNMPEAMEPVFERWGRYVAAQADAFAAANPQAHVVRLPHGNHYVFQSNPDDVEREMKGFMDGLRLLQ